MSGPSGFSVEPESLDADATALLKFAGRLQAYKPQLSLIEQMKAPNSHREVAEAALSFAEFAQDQYQDAVALLAALSTNLTNTADWYRKIDEDNAARLDKFLKDSQYRQFYERGL